MALFAQVIMMLNSLLLRVLLVHPVIKQTSATVEVTVFIDIPG